MPWTWLALAAIFEIVWAVGIKYTHGLTRIGPTIPTVLAMLASFYCLAMATRDLPIGTAYAIWTGAGAAGTAILGIVLFDESRALARVGSILLIVAGTIGLKLSTR